MVSSGGPQERDHQQCAGDQGHGGSAGGGGEAVHQGLGRGPTKSRVALTARVLRTAVPTLLPICIAVLAVAAATPASRGSTPLVATPIDGVKTQPMPRPTSTSAGRIVVR